ncbi:hypothetical protein AAFF_G00335260 [Aldrovandia affinis]|uniref:Uncharacterized protein n=1 Tax=Aldrovandia affinis TaxID=143900 RepID=A0AAD7SLG0_9TELE|nr:hypothetical protein AAFF_G00335260 [Aldrovandia affinis]
MKTTNQTLRMLPVPITTSEANPFKTTCARLPAIPTKATTTNECATNSWDIPDFCPAETGLLIIIKL